MAVLERNMRFFLEALHKEYALYQHMFELSQKERTLIEEGKIEELRVSLGKKNVLLDDVVRIEETITDLKHMWQQKNKEVLPELREEINTVLERFRALMEALMNYQKENEQIMYEYNVKKPADELSMVRKGKNLSKAYSVYNSAGRSQYMDKKR